MILWVDAQLSPSLAGWITDSLGLAATAVRELGLRAAKDFVIFQAAREANAIVLTKDADSPHLHPTWTAAESHLAHLRQHIE